MNDHIRVTADRTITDGHGDEVKAMAARMIETVRHGEPWYLRYEWFFSKDERTIYTVGLLEDPAAVMAHMANLSESIGPLSEIAPATRIEMFGDLSDEVQQFVAPFGAEVEFRIGVDFGGTARTAGSAPRR
jgi:quinol monooxygenase YgiN